MAPFNGTSPEMVALGKFFRDEGLFTFVRWNYFFTNPPLCISERSCAKGSRLSIAACDHGQAVQM
jgi:taurine--2-oxoglutarate transaminase